MLDHGYQWGKRLEHNTEMSVISWPGDELAGDMGSGVSGSLRGVESCCISLFLAQWLRKSLTPSKHLPVSSH